MERTPTGPGEPDGAESADRIAARLLAEVAAAKARLTDAARVIKEIDRSLAAGPQRPAPGRPQAPEPPSEPES
ncbi:hypothetical protein HUT16_00220 [Kitasatospora sp. NA04385]|uniref:hypothetical protein n=1 Tax=Kitasatospora sp. NA04385 TaxID=2742135 RepID=UPI00158FFC9A|nr:hypothetical protein [Kitasatospora sp. NA04385]QKW17694.1 hypothetical protein HUT16_00220 [Kitasatospora sp. NA04385]